MILFARLHLKGILLSLIPTFLIATGCASTIRMTSAEAKENQILNHINRSGRLSQHALQTAPVVAAISPRRRVLLVGKHTNSSSTRTSTLTVI
jgi:hypothetical protein